jgi:hypothetical protein
VSAAALVAQLVAAGTPPELLAAVAQELFMAEAERAALAERRKNERERTLRYRERGGDNIPQDMRQRVFERDGFRCQECGSEDRLECDHVIPVSKGGGTTDENLQVLCRSCNARKKDRIRKADVRIRSEEIQGHRPTSVETPSPLAPPKKAPEPQKITPPISPNPEDMSASADPPLTKREILEAWDQRMVPLGFPAVRKMTAQRERQLSARLRDSTIEDWQRAMDALERSRFCRGENDRGWRADFDFLLQPKSFTKLLEGAYDH